MNYRTGHHTEPFVHEWLQALNEKQYKPYCRGFSVALTAFANKVLKCLGVLPFGETARVFAPRQPFVLSSEEGMGKQVEAYKCFFRKASAPRHSKLR